jgi:hypothetical protein
MTGDARNDEAQPARREFLPLPGLAAISLYLVVLAVATVIGVVIGVDGHRYSPLFLALPVALFTASGGLLLLFRWAWALALSAVFLLAGYHLWLFSAQHQLPAMVQGMLNLVFFLYLVRPEVRERLR